MTAVYAALSQETALCDRLRALAALAGQIGTGKVGAELAALKAALDGAACRLRSAAADALVMLASFASEAHDVLAAFDLETYGPPLPQPAPEPEPEEPPLDLDPAAAREWPEAPLPARSREVDLGVVDWICGGDAPGPDDVLLGKLRDAAAKARQPAPEPEAVLGVAGAGEANGKTPKRKRGKR